MFEQGFDKQVRVLVELTSEWYKQKKVDNKPILVLAKNMIEWYQKKAKEVEEKNK